MINLFIVYRSCANIHGNQNGYEMDTAQKSLSFFSDEVLDTLFSGIQSVVDKDFEKQQICSSV